MTKGMYSTIEDISEKNSYLIPNDELRGLGPPYVKSGGFFDASKPVDPTVVSGSSLSIASIPSPISNKWIYLPDGNVSAPGLAWATETNSGLYKIAANNFGVSVNSTLRFDWNATRLKFASSYVFYLGATANICGDVGNDYIAITDSVNGGIRGQIKNTGTGAFSYGQWAIINNSNNDTAVRMNNSSLAVAGLHNTAGASVFSAGSNGTAAGPGGQPLILVNANNDASSEIWFGTRDIRRGFVSEAGNLGWNTTHARQNLEVVNVIRISTVDNGSNYADLSIHATQNSLVLTPTGGSVLHPAPSGSTFGATSYGITFADILDASSSHGYKIGFDSVGATKGYLRYNVDTNSAGSATWGHVFSGGPMSGVTNWAFIGGGRLGVNQMTPRARVDFLDAGAAQLRLTYTDNSVYADFQTDSSGNMYITPTGSTLGVSKSRVGGGVSVESSNTDNTNSVSHAIHYMSVGGPSGGDPYMRYDVIGGGSSWSHGIDNSDSDSFKIDLGTAVGSTNYFVILTGGNVGINTAGPDRKLDILDASNPQLRLTYTDGSVYTDLQTDSSGIFQIAPSSSRMHMTKSLSGGTVEFEIDNTSNTANSNTLLYMTVAGATANDVYIRMDISAVMPWCLGIDNSDSDKFKITNSTSLGVAGADYLTLTSGGDVQVSQGSNGQLLNIGRVTELTTIAAAATTDTAIQIPVDAVVFAVSVRVTVAIPTAVTFTVTGTTSGTQFDVAGGVSTAANTTDVGTRNCPYKNGAAQTIRITPSAVPAANTGRVRVTIHYYTVTVPTS